MREHDASSQKVTVIIAARDAERTIGAQLEALSRQTYGGDWEVVISDNGSKDRTVEIARAWASRLPDLRIVDSSSQSGQAHARNVAAAVARDLIAVCDADDVVEARWLEELVKGLESADLVGGALEHELLNGSRSTWRGGGERSLPRTHHFLPYAIGCNCAVRRSVWARIGGWSPTYSPGEDVDFSWRAQLTGFDLAFVPAAIVHYRHRTGIRESVRQSYRYAREEVQLLRDFREHGASRRTASEVAAAYGYALIRLPWLFSPRRRGFPLLSAADSLGRWAGSIRYRVFAP